MSPFRAASASILVAGLLAAAPTLAQTANGSPTAPASPGLPGTPPPVSRTAPSTGPRRMGPTAAMPDSRIKPPTKPTAADRAEQKKLEHDLNICIGC